MQTAFRRYFARKKFLLCKSSIIALQGQFRFKLRIRQLLASFRKFKMGYTRLVLFLQRRHRFKKLLSEGYFRQAFLRFKTGVVAYQALVRMRQSNAKLTTHIQSVLEYRERKQVEIEAEEEAAAEAQRIVEEKEENEERRLLQELAEAARLKELEAAKQMEMEEEQQREMEEEQQKRAEIEKAKAEVDANKEAEREVVVAEEEEGEEDKEAKEDKDDTEGLSSRPSFSDRPSIDDDKSQVSVEHDNIDDFGDGSDTELPKGLFMGREEKWHDDDHDSAYSKHMNMSLGVDSKGSKESKDTLDFIRPTLLDLGLTKTFSSESVGNEEKLLGSETDSPEKPYKQAYWSGESAGAGAGVGVGVVVSHRAVTYPIVQRVSLSEKQRELRELDSALDKAVLNMISSAKISPTEALIRFDVAKVKVKLEKWSALPLPEDSPLPDQIRLAKNMIDYGYKLLKADKLIPLTFGAKILSFGRTMTARPESRVQSVKSAPKVPRTTCIILSIYIRLYYTPLYSTILYYTTLNCTQLYSTLLNYTQLYSTIRYFRR